MSDIKIIHINILIKIIEILILKDIMVSKKEVFMHACALGLGGPRRHS